ncbi:MAG: translation elongation factor-like protein [Acidobacteria bacterium]|nr:translation elongation factor-like protein [Acidobacteriota bacterium]
MERKVGVVTHYFGKIGVAAIELAEDLRVGDTIHVKGHTSDFVQRVDSLQLDHGMVDSGHAGESVGMKLAGHAREHDEVYKVIAD